ncbi:hypothetical protein SAMN05216553_101162 [Lentzea fradiae]|uniref:Uncharacterized protein n=1 Tax=Lentzea fradiae TaxID=200378 RepID=A0A1G7KAC8_9PSEU|nr:hypothetical protein [Lentzea fradiae]SDF34000.1 hypothetical protein SAMN05216553_101162 [Lentzea fradiae]
MAIRSTGVGGILAVALFSMLLTSPLTAATTPPHTGYRPAVTRMAYETGDLAAVVHSPRTLVGVRQVVFSFRGNDAYAEELARQGYVVVLPSDRLVADAHRDLWRALARGEGPLAQRFGGFAGHVTLAEVRSPEPHQPIG